MAKEEILDLALRIRALELKLLELFKAGKLSGTVHTYVGQELCAASFVESLDPEKDAVFATHRGHGWYLASGGPMDGFFAELMGKVGALCEGRGGSQHLFHKNFFSSGIQGATALLATGWAWGMKRKGSHSVAIAQIGDGTLGEGALYEGLTFAALLQAPVLFVLEWNGCAQSTDVSTTTPGDILKRIEGFGIEVDRRSDEDPVALSRHLQKVMSSVREGKPFFQIIDTRRLMSHSKGDDNRPQSVLEQLWRADPLSGFLEKDAKLKKRFEEIQEEIQSVVAEVSSRPQIVDSGQSAWTAVDREISSEELRPDSDSPKGRVVEDLNRALYTAMKENSDSILLGEDLLDPYGGAFKVSRGLSSAFPSQVFSTPISEAAIVGVANGLALAGSRPIAEIMFADFVTLAVDQIVNHSAKFHYMYGNKISCPVTIRIPSGGGRGYGPTHSQSLEKLFFGVPGLRVVACSKHHSASKLLKDVVSKGKDPTVFVENKLLYAAEVSRKAPLDLQESESSRNNGDYPPLIYTPEGGAPADVTLVTYGGMVDVCEEAMKRLIFEDELRFDFIVLTQLWPLTDAEVLASVKRTGRLVVVEEGTVEFGVGAALISSVAQSAGLSFRSKCVGMRPVPIPCSSHLEKTVLPSAEMVVSAARGLL